MSVDHLYFEWYVEDGWLWVRHDCNGEIKEWHPDSRWSMKDGHPEPSFDCDDCGRHTILTESQRIDPPPTDPGDNAPNTDARGSTYRPVDIGDQR